MKTAAACWVAAGLLSLSLAAPVDGGRQELTGAALLEQVQRRAVRFFVEKSDTVTGLVNDRASNSGNDEYTVASTAATGYGLAALAVGAQRGWIPREEAKLRALRVLRFVDERMPHRRGWLFHFVDRRTGERVWNSEVSSIDTALFIAGALVCGQYFRGEVQHRANRLYNRLDWPWIHTNGGEQPEKRVVSHGWTPEKGFIRYDYDTFCEATLLYLLGLGAARNSLPKQAWDAWKRPVYRYRDRETLTGGPIFLNQMAHGYYDFRDRRDSRGWDYWVSGVNATWIHRKFCADRAGPANPYGADFWGINASDGPRGYRAHGIPRPEDGTLSPTGAISSIIFTPAPSIAAAGAMYRRLAPRIWGHYGFANAFNLDADWFGPDVIGIDLGMALLAIENYRTGFFWRLMSSHPSTARALAAAGLARTREPLPRPLRRALSPRSSKGRTRPDVRGGRTPRALAIPRSSFPPTTPNAHVPQ